MPTLRRRNNWTWGKPCSCCAQFDADQTNKKTRASRPSPPPPPPEAVQVVTVPTEPYSNLHSIITRTMDSYYGYGSPYGGMVGHDSYNPWHRTRG